jgi:hypothetical protein
MPISTRIRQHPCKLGAARLFALSLLAVIGLKAKLSLLSTVD